MHHHAIANVNTYMAWHPHEITWLGVADQSTISSLRFTLMRQVHTELLEHITGETGAIPTCRGGTTPHIGHSLELQSKFRHFTTGSRSWQMNTLLGLELRQSFPHSRP